MVQSLTLPNPLSLLRVLALVLVFVRDLALVLVFVRDLALLHDHDRCWYYHYDDSYPPCDVS